VGATPACNFQSGLCQVCTVAFGDLGSNSSACNGLNGNGTACQGSGPNVFCGCNDDNHCGRNFADPSKSGRICNPTTRLCIDGCSRAAGRNDCRPGQFCTAMGNATGVCTINCNFDVDCTGMAGMPYCVGGGDAGVPRCAQCRTNTDCGSAQPICRPENVCGCNANSDCTTTLYCDPVTHQCAEPPDLLPAPDMAVQLPDMGEGRDLSASADDGGTTPPPPPGCGCVLTGDAPHIAVIPLVLLALALALRRRGRRV
jgi:MYXO-CTERM domain-containing protein